MSRKLHEALVSAGLASMMGLGLGYAVGNLSLGLAMGAVLPITWAAQRCKLAR